MNRFAPLVALLSSMVFAQPLVSGVVTGLLSFDVFIPAGIGPGVNAFDIYNFTGPGYGPVAGTPYAADSLTFDNTVLTVFLVGGSSQVFDLGNIDPGELLGSDGSPIVQFPSTTEFTSAELTATLSPSTFMLSSGANFAAVPSIAVSLTPSSGDMLVAGVDVAPVYAEPASTATPEPRSITLIAIGLLGLAARRWR